jgi:hypothetical protein
MKSAALFTRFKIILSVCIFICFNGHAQENSPWRKVNDKILNIKNVYFAPGCHQYSLTGGQGFSVYIKNKNPHIVYIKGNLVAKTYCGTDIVSPFVLALKSKGISNGGSYDDPDNNGQAGVVSPADCRGISYLVRINKGRNSRTRYVRYTNRIKTVVVTNVEVIFPDSIVIKKKAEIAKIIPVPATTASPVAATVKEENNDSLINRKLLWYQHVDSLEAEVRKLRIENDRLTDSLDHYKSLYDQQKINMQLLMQPPATKSKRSNRKKHKDEPATLMINPKN